MASMPLQFRTQSTQEAKLGVSIFTIYALHLAYDQNLSLAASTLLLMIVALISAFFLFVEPIPQPQSYHNFADKRKRFFLCSCHAATEGFFLPPGTKKRSGFIIPNVGDVVSNIIILAGGVSGLVLLHLHKSFGVELEPSRQWQLGVCLPIFFSSTVAISAGSTYYHWSPNDKSLVWDRLPMTLAFVSIFCYMLEEYMPSTGVGQSLMPPLLILGIFSVLYWRVTDDLRLYALVQFLPLILIAAFVVCLQPRHGGAIQQAVAVVCYAVAKFCEERDYEIFILTNNRISGHSLKHVIAGLASISVASMLLIKEANS
ncbi:hypothetical protein ACHAXR_009378 [Thalassiosira sp. AJA248-18]